jgi:hypothetical protein
MKVLRGEGSVLGMLQLLTEELLMAPSALVSP